MPETTRPVEEVTPPQQQELATTTQDALRSRSQVAPEESRAPTSASPTASPAATTSPPASADGGYQIQSSLSGEIAEVAANATVAAGAASEESSEDPAEILAEQQRTQARNNPYADLSAGQPAQATRGGSVLDLSV
ncbi:hypothetical protein [Thiorhodococcus drewsii]|uniref:hypothetical protein n=1 Tax=Thiorhodococcus drewsii TaxID=210408 RepID=UPI0011123CD9|nr:hypothetical protein [Thiorhodococcus drewsii]